jgi:hypothetical protein
MDSLVFNHWSNSAAVTLTASVKSILTEVVVTAELLLHWALTDSGGQPAAWNAFATASRRNCSSTKI